MAGRKKMTAAEAAELKPGQFLIQGSKDPDLIRYDGLYYYNSNFQQALLERMDAEGYTDSVHDYDTIEEAIHGLQLDRCCGRLRVATPSEVAAFEKKVLANQVRLTKKFCRTSK